MIILNGKRIDGIVGDTLPIGTISAYAGLVAPKGYLLCQGQLIDKAKYPELYNLCGDTFGTATTTQFYLPDLQNKVIGGYKPNDDIFGTFGSSVGAKSVATGNHTLTTDEMPSHKHNVGYAGNLYYQAGSTGWWTGGLTEEDLYTDTKGTEYAGGNGAHNHGNITIVQPTIVLNWIIKAFTIVPNQSEVVNIISQSSIDVYSANFVNSLLDQMKQEAFDFAHPVGSYYETSDSSWTPTSAGWYGTWVEDNDGSALVSYKSSGVFNKATGTIVGGETTSYTPAGSNSGGAVGSHTLTAAESGLPSHAHQHKGYKVLTQNSGGTEKNAVSWGNDDDAGGSYTRNAGGTNATSGHSHPFTNPTFTGTQADISTIQTSKVVYRWHRIA